MNKRAAKLAAGALSVDVERIYPLAQLTDAVAHAARGRRSGKILVSCAAARPQVAAADTGLQSRCHHSGGTVPTMPQARVVRCGSELTP